MFDFLKNLLTASPINTGLLLDSEEYNNSLPKHEYIAGFLAGEATLNPDWKALAPIFRNQQTSNMCTAFAATNAVSMLNALETGKKELFSPIELFFRANGELYGNTVQNTEKAIKEAVLLDSVAPWPSVNGTLVQLDGWNPVYHGLMKAYIESKTEGKLAQGKKYAVRSLTSVIPTVENMRLALKSSPLLAIVHVGYGYFDKVAPRVTSGALHLVVITKILDNGRIEIMDSIANSSTFDGFHVLAHDFNVLNCYGIVDLPNDWKEVQENAENSRYYKALNRYGKPEKISLEMQVTMKLQNARKSNPTHIAYLDRDWKVYVMAITYGGYSVQDVLNHITSLRRSNKPIFDFNNVR